MTFKKVRSVTREGGSRKAKILGGVKWVICKITTSFDGRRVE